MSAKTERRTELCEFAGKRFVSKIFFLEIDENRGYKRYVFKRRPFFSFFLEIVCNCGGKSIVLEATLQLDKLMQLGAKIRLRLGKFIEALGQIF